MTKPISVDSVVHDIQHLEAVLAESGNCIIACSGGIDSMLLATIAYRAAPQTTRIAHAISAAVPEDATQRVKNWGDQEGWQVEWLTAGEFADERYLSNPVNRCYYCKSNLYNSLQQLNLVDLKGYTPMSGANLDDLGEYRPGLIAAEEFAVRHPYIEAKLNKASIRAIARHLQLPFSEIPASPCLASRLYTGTRVTSRRLGVIESGENLIRVKAKVDVVRCRVRDKDMLIEVKIEDRHRVTDEILKEIRVMATDKGLQLNSVTLDSKPYSPGRAFVGAR